MFTCLLHLSFLLFALFPAFHYVGVDMSITKTNVKFQVCNYIYGVNTKKNFIYFVRYSGINITPSFFKQRIPAIKPTKKFGSPFTTTYMNISKKILPTPLHVV